MLSLILYGALALVVAAVVVSVLVVVLPDDTVSVAARDRVPAALPASGEVAAHDVDKVRLPVVVRGYRMVDTDAVLDRLSAEIDRRDQEIAALRAASTAPEEGSVVLDGQPVASVRGATMPADEEHQELHGAYAAADAQQPVFSTAPAVDHPVVEPVAQPEMGYVPTRPAGEQP